MITKKRKKTNTKPNGYNLNNIATTKAVQPIRTNGALHGFFSFMGFIISIGSLIAMLVLFLMPIMAHAKQGTFITEPFSCEVALANYHHLTKTTKEDNPKFAQEQLELSLKSVTQELKEHQECKGGTDAN